MTLANKRAQIEGISGRRRRRWCPPRLLMRYEIICIYSISTGRKRKGSGGQGRQKNDDEAGGSSYAPLFRSIVLLIHFSGTKVFIHKMYILYIFLGREFRPRWSSSWTRSSTNKLFIITFFIVRRRRRKRSGKRLRNVRVALIKFYIIIVEWPDMGNAKNREYIKQTKSARTWPSCVQAFFLFIRRRTFFVYFYLRKCFCFCVRIEGGFHLA